MSPKHLASKASDLYAGDIGTRLRYALGFHSLYELGAAVPSWLCKGVVRNGLGPSKSKVPDCIAAL